jgi:hypothetical protein
MSTETINDVASAPVADEMVQVTDIIDGIGAVVADHAEQVEASIETFDEAFKGDPLAAKYREFGELARELYDPTDTAYLYVDLGRRGYNLMWAEKTTRPAAYDRSRVVKKMESALRLCGVPESMCRPNEILGIFWVARLDQSTPNADGESRSYPTELSEGWFGGNLSVAALRMLAKLINRASKKDEVDVYEYDHGYEGFSRSMIARLQRGDISVRQLDARIKAERKRVEDERERLATMTLNAHEKQDRETTRLAKEKEAKFTRLRKLLDDAKEFADRELKLDKEQMEKTLIAKNIIAAHGRETPRELAKNITPAEAKGLVQCLAELAEAGDVGRESVLRVLIAECSKCLKNLAEHKNESAEQRKSA